MTIILKPVEIPAFGTPRAMPQIPGELYARRCETLHSRAEADWVVVYADREHLANFAFLTGFEPRFEEALLVLGPGGRRVAILGNESTDYAQLSPLEGLEVALCQSFSLLGQPRDTAAALGPALRRVGLTKGCRIGLVGWKYLSAEEFPGQSFYASAHVVDELRLITDALFDATPILMNPADGLRAIVDVHQIAQGEWGAARASDAVWRMIRGLRPGEDEFTAAARMGYAGEELSAHVMFATAPAGQPVVGLKSPRGRIYSEGEGLSCAVSYWGGLSARAGVIAHDDPDFVERAKAYFAGLCEWYAAVDIGVMGSAVNARVRAKLAEAGLSPMLNPGHLVGHDEWISSPMVSSPQIPLASGMPFQVDVIPSPMPRGKPLNCEDAVTLADADLQAELSRMYPEVAGRIEARRSFLRDGLGLEVRRSIMPLSNTPLCLAPLLLRPQLLLALR